MKVKKHYSVYSYNKPYDGEDLLKCLIETEALKDLRVFTVDRENPFSYLFTNSIIQEKSGQYLEITTEDIKLQIAMCLAEVELSKEKIKVVKNPKNKIGLEETVISYKSLSKL